MLKSIKKKNQFFLSFPWIFNIIVCSSVSQSEYVACTSNHTAKAPEVRGPEAIAAPSLRLCPSLHGASLSDCVPRAWPGYKNAK